ncbi:RNA-directed DNA polymerase, eukaryota, reverse transcriptase zinc-binding domain protein [Tanacetum coccineum]|uniref:RNA-directed DNA polymerase, eukaryota, reverse transcriptase zinc-binding domain protein n=1 Tax=Tanacetum coccineum TaxID=301880 RepID=A0ABQ5C942_9ASTR
MPQIVQEKGVSAKVLPCQLPPKVMNPRNFTLSCTIGSLNFYAMADLGASVNVIPKSMFEHLKLAQLKKTGMVVEMVDMMKRSPIGIVENVLVKIDKFLFPSDFMVMDMLNTRNETIILGRSFLLIIHAEIDVFNKEISLGIGGDRVTFDMDKKSHNFTTPVGKIYMMNTIHNEESPSLISTPSDRGIIKGGGLSFPEFLLVKYEEVQKKELIWDNRYEEWCNENSSPNTPTSKLALVQEDYKPRRKDYPFKDWLLAKVGHTKLADEYELGIGKKGHILDDISENYKKVQGDNTYWWHDKKSKEEERQELGINIEEYDPPMVHVETFEIKRYSFDSGQNFICVTKELMDALPLGRKNGSRFKDMIRKEVDIGRRIYKKT